MKATNKTCILYASTDLAPEGEKVLTLNLSIERKQFSVDLLSQFEGSGRILVRDGTGKPVNNATVVAGGRIFVSDPKGTVELPLLRGTYTMKVEKPGYVTREGKIQIVGRIYQFLPFLKKDNQVLF
jgi:uncharacterized membrane protein